MTPRAAPDARLREIEILRGYAILLVLAAHVTRWLVVWPIPVWSHIVGHYLEPTAGVDLFFVISGFVIGRSLVPALTDAGAGRPALRVMLAFWVRRFWRLLPAAWVWLALSLLLAFVLNRHHAFGTLHDAWEGAAAAFLLVANIHLAETFAGFRVGANFHYWSLSLEEQFYLLLPVAIWLSGRALPRVVALCFLLFVALPDTPLVATCRAHGLILGVGLALLRGSAAAPLLTPRFLAGNAAARMAVTVLPIAAMCALSVPGERIVPHRWGVLALLGAVPVFVASHDQGWVWPSGRLGTVLTWFGARSYALYLAHVACYDATRELVPMLAPALVGNTGVYLGGGLGLSLVAAEVTHRYVEKPFRARGRRIAKRM